MGWEWGGSGGVQDDGHAGINSQSKSHTACHFVAQAARYTGAADAVLEGGDRSKVLMMQRPFMPQGGCLQLAVLQQKQHTHTQRTALSSTVGGTREGRGREGIEG